jgi:hypothetical protein
VNGTKVWIVATAAVALIAVGASPARAAPTDDTEVTFEVTAGTLDIVAPAGHRPTSAG